MLADRPINTQLVGTGAGVALDPATTLPADLRGALRSLQAPSLRAASTRLQAEIQARPAPATVVGRIEDLVAASGSARAA